MVVPPLLEAVGDSLWQSLLDPETRRALSITVEDEEAILDGRFELPARFGRTT